MSAPRRERVLVSLGSWAISIPLGAWMLMLLDGAVAPGGLSYPGALLWTTVGAFAVQGIGAEWRYIRDGAR